MADVFTLTSPVITVDMDTFKVTAVWQLPPPPVNDPNVSDVTVTHIVTLDLGKAVVQLLHEPAAEVTPKQADKTDEG